MQSVPQVHRYHQVHLVLRQRIVDGFYSKNSLIAGERDLAMEFGVSRVTIRSALSALACEGMVRREQGRGTITVGPLNSTGSGADELSAFDVLFDSILSMGLRTKVVTLDFRIVEVPLGVANTLRIVPGSQACRLTRVRSLKQCPVLFSTVWMARELAHDLTEKELTGRPLLTWLYDNGVTIKRTDETLSACAADIDVAYALGLPVGSALLLVRRVAFDGDDRPVLFFDGQFHPKHYQYHLQLSHVQRTARVTVKIS